VKRAGIRSAKPLAPGIAWKSRQANKERTISGWVKPWRNRGGENIKKLSSAAYGKTRSFIGGGGEGKNSHQRRDAGRGSPHRLKRDL